MANNSDIWKEYDKILNKNKTDKNDIVCCKHTYRVEDEHETCISCGHVINNLMSIETDWRPYDKTEKRKRCTKIDMVFQSRFSTSMGGYKGHNRLRMHHKWLAGMIAKERNQLNIFATISHVSYQYSIPEMITNQAQIYYKQINDNRISKRDNIKGLPAVCLYYACKQNNYARSPEEISKMFFITLKIFTTAKKRFKEVLSDINFQNKPCDDIIEVNTFISRFCQNLGLSFKIIKTIKQVIKNAQKLGCTDHRKPISLAAGAIFFVVTEYNFNIKKEEVATSCNVSAAIVHLTYKELVIYSDLLIGKYVKCI